MSEIPKFLREAKNQAEAVHLAAKTAVKAALVTYTEKRADQKALNEEHDPYIEHGIDLESLIIAEDNDPL